MGNVIRLLITGAGAPGFAGIYGCLKDDPFLEVWCCDANPQASGSSLCPLFFPVPRAGDSSFVSELLNLSLEHKIQFILPIVTSELEALAPQQDLFRQNDITILMNPEGVLKKVNNKCSLYSALSEMGISVPDFRVILDWSQMHQAAIELGYPEKDLIMKPCQSNGSRGFRVISEQFDALKLLFEEKPSAFPMKLDELIQMLKNKDFPPLMLSEFLPGPEYSVDMICDSGKTLLCIPRLRSRINNGISVAGRIENHGEIIQYCSDIADKMKLHGFNGIQVKQARDNTFKILEINPRLQGTTSAIRLAGINIPQLGINYWAKGQEFDRNWSSIIQWNTSFFRVYQDYKLEPND